MLHVLIIFTSCLGLLGRQLSIIYSSIPFHLLNVHALILMHFYPFFPLLSEILCCLSKREAEGMLVCEATFHGLACDHTC